MALGERENQLELFDVANQPVARVRRASSVGWLAIHLRYDQAILATIGALLALTVIFACGVERGKQLVRSEALQVARQSHATAPAAAAEAKPAAAPERPALKKPEAGSAKKEPQGSTAPAMAPMKKVKTRVAEPPPTGRSRYAIQLATYTQPQLAKTAMERLHARGESAFLVLRDGRAMVYAGPFPSKDHASEKLVNLKSQYQGCFIKTL